MYHNKFILLIAFCLINIQLIKAEEKPIIIETSNTALIIKPNPKGKLLQLYFGEKLAMESDYQKLKSTHEAYIQSGIYNLNEPAIRMLHNDENPSLELKFVKVEVFREDDNLTKTVIYLKDNEYPVEVRLRYKAFNSEDIIETWTEIKYNENKPVLLSNFASNMLHFDERDYFLTQFHGDWSKEMMMKESRLTSGMFHQLWNRTKD